MAGSPRRWDTLWNRRDPSVPSVSAARFLGPTGEPHAGEVVGFRGSTVLSMPLERLSGIRYGDRIATWGAKATLRVGEELLGRVIDGQGKPLDSRPDYHCPRGLAAALSRPLAAGPPIDS